MRSQRPELRHRVIPPSVRPQRSTVRSQVRYPTKLQWLMAWLGAGVLSLLLFGLLLEMHC